MRATLVLCACLLVLLSGATGAVAEIVESDEQVEQVVRELFSAWSEHDLDRIDSIFAEGGTYEDVPPQKTYRGAEEIKGFLTAIWAWAPDIEFELTSVAVAEDTVVSEWVMTGTQTGPIGPIPASGNPLFCARCFGNGGPAGQNREA